MDESRKWEVINKAIFLLIEKYHRLYGLEFYLFSHSSFGTGYWGFQQIGILFNDGARQVDEIETVSGS